MSFDIISYKDYVAGWLDSSVHDFVETLPANASTKYALITCLDSHRQPASLLEKSPELARLAKAARPLGSGLVLPAELLKIESDTKIFFGFDEVWFFPDDDIEPKPDTVWLVGPARIDRSWIEPLGEWMARNSCSLGLGDGAGLNVIVKARGLVRHLIGHTLWQPQATPVFVAQ